MSLTTRETEVLALVVRGFEDDRHNSAAIGLSTPLT